MNSFLLRIYKKSCSCKTKATLQVFISTSKAMCFTSNFEFDDFLYLYKYLYIHCGIKVVKCRLVTSVWIYNFMKPIKNLQKFYSFCKTQKGLIFEYEPELFPCVTLKIPKSNFVEKEKAMVTARIYHTGKVVLLGIQCVRELVIPLETLFSLWFNFTIENNFDNF